MSSLSKGMCHQRREKRLLSKQRKPREGNSIPSVYGKPSVVDIGPIEKAPLYHFIPGHFRLCLTCASCNLRCKHCQNWYLSQKSFEELDHYSYSPSEIVQQAKKQGLNSISFTYTEPTVYYEYLYDISAHRQREWNEDFYCLKWLYQSRTPSETFKGSSMP